MSLGRFLGMLFFGVVVGGVFGVCIAFIASMLYYDFFPSVTSVNVSAGMYEVPNGYLVWWVDGEVCHVAGVLKGRLEGSVSTVLTYLRYIPYGNVTVVCDYILSSRDNPLTVPHKGGKYFVLRPSTMYLVYDRPSNEDWGRHCALWGAVIGGAVLPLIVFLGGISGAQEGTRVDIKDNSQYSNNDVGE